MSCSKCLQQANPTLEGAGIHPSLAGVAFSREGNGPAKCPDCGQFMSEENHVCPIGKDGWWAAYIMASEAADVSPDTLRLTNKDGVSLAHMIASQGYKELSPEMLKPEMLKPEMLKLADKKGHTVAHTLAAQRRLPPEMWKPEILGLRDQYGWAVAHSLALKGGCNDLPLEILSLADDKGDTVAHVAAMNATDYRGFPPEIMCLKNNDGETVEDVWIWRQAKLRRRPTRRRPTRGMPTRR